MSIMVRKMKKKRPRRSFIRRFASGTAKALTIAGKALMVARGVKRLLNVEFKQLDSTLSGTIGASGTGSVVYLSGIAQGDGHTSRDGNSILAKSLMLRGKFVSNYSADNVVRMIIFADKQNVGTAPTLADMLQVNTSVYSFRNLGNGTRFKVLYDRTFKLAANTSLDFRTKNWKYFKKLQHHVKYVDTAAASTSAGRGSLWMILMSDQGTSMPTYSIQHRVRYIDN